MNHETKTFENSTRIELYMNIIADNLKEHISFHDMSQSDRIVTHHVEQKLLDIIQFLNMR